MLTRRWFLAALAGVVGLRLNPVDSLYARCRALRHLPEGDEAVRQAVQTTLYVDGFWGDDGNDGRTAGRALGTLAEALARSQESDSIVLLIAGE